MLEQSRQTLADTEEIGVSVIGNLHHQREQLLAAHSKVCVWMCVHRLYSPHNTPPHTLVYDE